MYDPILTIYIFFFKDLTATDLNKTIRYMHANQKYGKVSIICKFDNLFNFEMLYML